MVGNSNPTTNVDQNYMNKKRASSTNWNHPWPHTHTLTHRGVIVCVHISIYQNYGLRLFSLLFISMKMCDFGSWWSHSIAINTILTFRARSFDNTQHIPACLSCNDKWYIYTSLHCHFYMLEFDKNKIFFVRLYVCAVAQSTLFSVGNAFNALIIVYVSIFMYIFMVI